MATLAGQRAQFTYSLNEYNKAEDPERRTKFARAMAKVIADAPVNGFTVEQVTRGQNYPAAEVSQYINEAGSFLDVGLSEEQAERKVAEAVDSSNVIRLGDGNYRVYAYGYECCPDRLKIGYTEGDTVQRIAAQISTGTPDKPVLHIEIKTDNCRALERAIQSVLEVRGRKILGGGDEWFRVTRDEVLELYKVVTASAP